MMCDLGFAMNLELVIDVTAAEDTPQTVEGGFGLRPGGHRSDKVL